MTAKIFRLKFKMRIDWEIRAKSQKSKREKQFARFEFNFSPHFLDYRMSYRMMKKNAVYQWNMNGKKFKTAAIKLLTSPNSRAFLILFPVLKWPT